MGQEPNKSSTSSRLAHELPQLTGFNLMPKADFLETRKTSPWTTMTSSVSRRLKTLFKGTVPKLSEFPEDNDDKFRACDTRQNYVLSDGAGVSYNSALWADVIVRAWFSAPPERNVLKWLRRAIREYESLEDTTKMSWSQRIAYERGSFASLLALQWTWDCDLQVTAVGDSIALLVSDGNIEWSFPYKFASQFEARPHLLSTILNSNFAPFFVDAARSIRANETRGPCHDIVPLGHNKRARLLCVTDALGEWLLRDCDEHSNRLNRIQDIDSDTAFVALVEEARAAGTLRRDDTTLIVLQEAS